MKYATILHEPTTFPKNPHWGFCHNENDMESNVIDAVQKNGFYASNDGHFVVFESYEAIQ